VARGKASERSKNLARQAVLCQIGPGSILPLSKCWNSDNPFSGRVSVNVSDMMCDPIWCKKSVFNHGDNQW